MKRTFFALFLAVLCTVTAYGRGHHYGPPPPRHHSHSIIIYDRPPRHHDHHHHHGPSRGWYNGLLVTSAILGGLDIITRPFTYERIVYAAPAPVIQHPIVIQANPAPQPVTTNVTVNVMNVNDDKTGTTKTVVVPTPTPSLTPATSFQIPPPF